MCKSSTSSGQFCHVERSFLRRIHIIHWLPQYSKFDFVSDLVAGFTVGLMLIPQSIAYAGLASIPAQYGLYTAFIGAYTYVVFGTIKQVSIGPTSLLSMLTFTVLDGYPIDYVFFLTFLAGCIELAMGVLKLGFLVDFISPTVSAGFTSAIAIIVSVAQLKVLFGLKFVAHGCLEVVWMIGQNITNVKINDTILGLFSIAFLFAFKQFPKIKFRNRIIKKIIWFLSISRNALVVLITSSVAYYYCQVSEDGQAPFQLSPKVPSGLPEFSLPKFTLNNASFFDMLHNLGSGVIIVPLCAILSNVGIAKFFASGSGVTIDATQEMITLGLCNIFGSCVQAMPCSGAFSRSAVANASGVRTQMQGLYSGTIIILALSFLTPYFSFIPKSTIAAVIISSVFSMIEYQLLPGLWRTNKIDFLLALVTCGVGVIYGADVGIIVGALLNILVLLKEWSRPNIIIELGTLGKSSKSYVLIKPEFGLYYPARDYFSQKIMEVHNQYQSVPLVLDCSGILKIDYAAAEALNNLLELYNNEDDRLILINLNNQAMKTLENFTQTEKLRHCNSSSTISDDIFIKDLPETKVPLLDC